VVVTNIEEAEACLGAAILAGKASGLFKSVDEACVHMVRVKERFEPDTKNFEAYDELYSKYVGLYDSLCALFQQEK
jgi:xylulokinase